MSDKPHDYDGTGVCKRCGSDSFSGGSGSMCPKAPHDLTPSEVALAKMLSAAIDWLRPGHDDDSREANAIRRACAQFVDLGLMYAGTGQATETGRALLGRARRAGVL